MIKAFAINLISQTEKKEHILSECAKHHIDVEVIPAVNGKELSEEQIKAQVYDYPACSLTQGEIGCALSHISIYQRMIDKQYPLALILEDDAILDKNVDSILLAIKELETNNKQPQVYLLSPAHYYLESFKKTSIDHHTIHRIIDAHSAHGYVLNLAAATALNAFLQPIKYEADRWGYFQQMGIVNVSCIAPPSIMTSDEDKASSDLENERLKIRKNRDTYFRKLRKKEASLYKKIQHLFLKFIITMHLVKTTRENQNHP